MTPPPIILWLRNDLRLDDHAPLAAAVGRGGGAPLVPVYCLDPRHFELTMLGLPRTGPHRARFLLETLADLRRNLHARGGELFIRLGRPEDVIPRLAEQLGASSVYYHYESEARAVAVERRLIQKLKRQSVRTHGFWGSTLHHIADLPYNVEALPATFTQFRKEVERRSFIRDPLDAPERIPAPPSTIFTGGIPDVEDLWLEPIPEDDRSIMRFHGGETAAQARLDHYLWRSDMLRHFKNTRGNLTVADASSKFSPWLSIGALSARRIGAEVKRYERERVQNDSTYWMTFELRWRDFYKFLTLNSGVDIYAIKGLGDVDRPWLHDTILFNRWRLGETGVPFIDANMRELAATGFISSRGRLAVASFLAQTLGVDWRWGASYFATQQIDYDPCLNWLNWQQAAGVDVGARGHPYNVVAQGRKLDPTGTYIKRWLPELARVPSPQIHEPYTLPPRQLQRLFGVELGVNYPEPLIPTKRTYQAILPLG